MESAKADSININDKKIKAQVIGVLRQIPDPELGVSIWDLGLIYDVSVKSGKVEVLMTLTTIGCPLFSQICDPIRMEVGKLKGVKSVYVELTFEPPWSMEKMTEEARIQLGV